MRELVNKIEPEARVELAVSSLRKNCFTVKLLWQTSNPIKNLLE